MSVVSIRNLHYAYDPLLPGGEPISVLRGVDLDVEQGEFLSLMGPTGVGKTTLCMALNGLVPQATGGHIRGSVEVLGCDPRRTPVEELAARVGIVYQDPESQLFCTTVQDEVAFGPENLGVAAQEIKERVEWALNVVGMSSYGDRSPNQLSGGEKQRVAIAASLAMMPEVLILDEPAASLDPVGRFQVFEAIEALCQQRRVTIIMVSHDAEHVAQFSDRVAVMWEGRLARVGTPSEIFFDRSLRDQVGFAIPQVSTLAMALNSRYGTAYRFTRVDEAEEALRRDIAEQQAFRKTSEVYSSGTAWPQSASANEWMHRQDGLEDFGSLIRTQDLWYEYDATIPALNGVDLSIPDNAYLAVVGQNGSGKTTLVKHFNGLLKPTRGEVWVYGRSTESATVGELAHQVGYVFQNPDHQIFCATTWEEIAFGPRNLGLAPETVRARVSEALETFSLTPYAETPPAVLGYGLRRKVSIAAVYAMRPQILILDEPSIGLDWRSTQELMARVDELHDQGHTIILVTHDMRLVAEYTRQTLVMHEGGVLTYGPTEVVLCQTEQLKQAQIAPPQIARLAGRLTDLGFNGQALSVEGFCVAYGELWEGKA
ncbi:MAG: energy-coupling factor transporter ATPase [Chloroflexota bacterium]|nr:energy-coupling factor transporter ATPase [Chloroflexota bacterium]